MKTLRILFIVLFAIGMVNCKKDIQEDVEQMAEIEFAIDHVEPLLPKNDEFDIECPDDLVPVVAEIEINGITYNPAVFFVGGKLYTQTIKLPVGVYNITKFLLKNADGVVIMATPAIGSFFAPYVDKPVAFEFEVEEFIKKKIDIEVLCFLPINYDKFGFFWFQIERIVVRNFCFFGDICIKDAATYAQSLYANQTGFPSGGYVDAPAIFKVVVKKNGVPVPYSPFTNASVEAGWGLGEPVCVRYPDNIDIAGEVFTFELWVYVNKGYEFGYVKFHTFTATDDGVLVKEDGAALPAAIVEAGVLDFVLGSCNYANPGLQLAPWQVLPTSASINISHNASYPTGGYWKMIVNSFTPAGNNYDLMLGEMVGWCADQATTIGQGTHNFMIYSSLDASNWPAMPGVFTKAKISQVNWLMNHLSDYGLPALTGMYINPGFLSGAQGQIIQAAIWKIINGTASSNAIVNTMAADAASHSNFIPLPGQYAAVIVAKDGTPIQFQLIIIIVDP